MNIKKMLLLLLLFIMPFVVNAETCNPEKVTIESIVINNKTDNVVEKSAPSVSGKNLNIDLGMFEVGDAIEYKMVVKNESGSDYELDRTSLSKSSDFIEYILETKDNSTIVKDGETKEVIIRVQYKNQVTDDAYVNGVYNDNKNLAVNLSSETPINPIVNPKTGVYTSLIILPIFIISGILTIILNRRKYGRFFAIILGILIILPVSVYALCKCEINVDSKVEIIKSKKVCAYVGHDQCGTPEISSREKRTVFVPIETTVGEFLSSQRQLIIAQYPNEASFIKAGNFVKNTIMACEESSINDYKNGTILVEEYNERMINCYDNHTEIVTEEISNTPVKESSEGCYDLTISTAC